MIAHNMALQLTMALARYARARSQRNARTLDVQDDGPQGDTPGSRWGGPQGRGLPAMGARAPVPESKDYDDGNWLRVTSHCGASGASVWAQGAILMVTDIAGFGDQCAAMLGGDRKSAALDPFEPIDRLGHLRVQVEVTPDHLAQAHRFEFEVDQSYLPGRPAVLGDREGVPHPWHARSKRRLTSRGRRTALRAAADRQGVTGLRRLELSADAQRWKRNRVRGG